MKQETIGPLAKEAYIAQILSKVHIDHHNFKGAMAYMIKIPAESLLALDTLPSTDREKISKIAEQASTVYNKYAHLTDTNETDPERKYNIIKDRFADVPDSIVPDIKRIINEYKSLLDQPIFNDSPESDQTRMILQEVVDDCDKFCDELIMSAVLTENLSSRENEIEEKINLVDSIERILNLGLPKVTVELSDHSEKNIFIKQDKENFERTVLQNIRTNIETHAFPNEESDTKSIFDKKVRIGFHTYENKFQVEIANNGKPLRDEDLSQMFKPKKNHGYGMYSAKQFMQSIGGDITMEPTPNDEYKVKIVLTFNI